MAEPQIAAETTPPLPSLDEMPVGAIPADNDSQNAGIAKYQTVAEAGRARSQIMAQQAGDVGLGVEFYLNPIDGLDHVRILIPGDKLYQPDFIAEEHYQQRFAHQWEAYRQERSQYEGQTMLADVIWMDQEVREHLAYWNIRTVEGLSEVPDGTIDRIGMGGRALRDRARRAIDEQKKAAGYDDLAQRIEAMEKSRAEEIEAAVKARLEEIIGPDSPAPAAVERKRQIRQRAGKAAA